MIDNLKHIADLQAIERDKFLCRPLPDDVAGEMGQIIHENSDLRQRLVLCQIEYEKTQELARENYRRYADKCKEDSKLAYWLAKAEKQIKDLDAAVGMMQALLDEKDAQIAKLKKAAKAAKPKKEKK